MKFNNGESIIPLAIIETIPHWYYIALVTLLLSPFLLTREESFARTVQGYKTTKIITNVNIFIHTKMISHKRNEVLGYVDTNKVIGKQRDVFVSESTLHKD